MVVYEDGKKQASTQSNPLDLLGGEVGVITFDLLPPQDHKVDLTVMLFRQPMHLTILVTTMLTLITQQPRLPTTLRTLPAILLLHLIFRLLPLQTQPLLLLLGLFLLNGEGRGWLLFACGGGDEFGCLDLLLSG